MAAKVPAVGTVDLYAGTAVIVKPHQCALFVHKGQIADVLLAGTHQITTENMPILTRLANWRFGFESPLRCELIFVAGHILTARRWGTARPILVNIEDFGAVPIRCYGNFNVAITDPKAFYLKIMGSRTAYSISELEEFIQGQIVELLPEVFNAIKTFDQLSTSQNELSKKLELILNQELKSYGIACQKIQILSALPSKEIIEAIDAKTAIKVIGSQKEYLLYKAANSLTGDKDKLANDPMQMMMGLMLGKGLLGADYHEKEAHAEITAKAICTQCGLPIVAKSLFCSQCGKKV
jgi:membrane protease subunit (stomatin/prohibitin family)